VKTAENGAGLLPWRVGERRAPYLLRFSAKPPRELIPFGHGATSRVKGESATQVAWPLWSPRQCLTLSLLIWVWSQRRRSVNVHFMAG